NRGPIEHAARAWHVPHGSSRRVSGRPGRWPRPARKASEFARGEPRLADQPPTSPRIFTYLDARIPVRCYEHMAIVRRGGASTSPGAEFLSEGLYRGQRCCFLAPAALHTGMLARLRELGVDVERHLGDQTLQFPPPAPAAADVLDGAKNFFAEAEAAHAPAVR